MWVDLKAAMKDWMKVVQLAEMRVPSLGYMTAAPTVVVMGNGLVAQMDETWVAAWVCVTAE